MVNATVFHRQPARGMQSCEHSRGLDLLATASGSSITVVVTESSKVLAAVQQRTVLVHEQEESRPDSKGSGAMGPFDPNGIIIGKSSRSPGYELPPAFFLPHFLDGTNAFVAKRSGGRVGIVMISGAVAVRHVGEGARSHRHANRNPVRDPMSVNCNRVFCPPPHKNTTVWPVPVCMSPSSSRRRHVANDVQSSA